jgi:hypothetical protein
MPTVTPRIIQKARELAWVKEAQSLDALPQGEVVSGESPDALIVSDGVTIGVEVTEYVRGRSPRAGGSAIRAVEEAADKFVRSAQETFQATSHVPLYVTVAWHGGLPPRERPLRTALAAELASLVERHAPDQILRDVRVPDEALWRTPLLRYIHSPWVMRLKADH